jgi:hypothetical protein
LSSAGEIAQIIAVRELPPKALRKINVNFESRYGTNCFYIFVALSAKIYITRPNVDNDWFILAVSRSLSFESIPVLATHSLPAKSTKFITLYFMFVCAVDS